MTFRNRTFITAGALIAATVIVLASAYGFRASCTDNNKTVANDSAAALAYKLPDELYFAGERMPLENIDTRESLDREILTTTYRHSSTILTIKRARRYFPVIEKILKQNNIPDDFKYLAAAESEYHNVISPAGAVGFWQIMAGTGREHGMEINSIVDERYNVEISTRFACDYFRKSYEKYGNWTLVAASYNGGRRRVDEQINMQKQKNYYDLLFTEETARFVFRVAAYKLIISDPAAYGFIIPEEEMYPELKYHEVKVDTSVKDFAAFAGHFGTNYKILKQLNPWLRQPYLTPKQGKTYIIKVPSEGMRNAESYRPTHN